MSRSDVLVDADWVEAHLDDPKVVLVEVDEDTSAYEKNHIRNAIRIDWTDDLQDPVRRDFVDQEGFEKLLSAKGIANDDTVVSSTAATTTGSRPTPTGTSSCTATRTSSSSTAAARSGSSTARELVAEVPVRPATEYKAKAQDTLHPRLPRRRRRRASARRTWSTCARPTSSPASCSPRRTCRRSSRSAGPRPDRPNIPWSKTANDDGTFKSDDELQELYAEARGRPGQGHHRVLPHR